MIEETEGRTSALPELDRNLLRAAREMTTNGSISAETFSTLQASLDHELMVEITMVIAFYIGVVHLLASLEIDVEPDYLPYLERYPL